MNCQSRLHWMIQRYPFEAQSDGLAMMYRVPGQTRYHGSKLDALDAAIYAQGVKAVTPDRRASK